MFPHAFANFSLLPVMTLPLVFTALSGSALLCFYYSLYFYNV